MPSYLSSELARTLHRKPNSLGTKVTHNTKQHAKLPFIKASSNSTSQAAHLRREEAMHLTEKNRRSAGALQGGYVKADSKDMHGGRAGADVRASQRTLIYN